MFKWLDRKKVNLHANTGDAIELYHDIYKNGEEPLLRSYLTKPVHITEIITFEYEDEFNHKKGFGGAFGQEND